jgi:hypothetical protein
LSDPNQSHTDRVTEAFIDLRKQIIITRLEHSGRADENTSKALAILNGTALIALASIYGPLLEHSVSLLCIKIAMSIYLIGLCAAAGVFFLLGSIILETPEHFYNEFIEYLNGTRSYDALSGYGLTNRGRLIFRILACLSLIAFFAATCLLIYSI